MSFGRFVSSHSGGMTPSFLLPREGLLAQLVPALVEPALVLGDPVRGNVVRRVRGAGREVDEERLLGRDRLLLADVADRLVGQVLHQVVALLGGAVRLDRRRAVVQLGIELVVLAADEAEEVLEARARGPVVERSDRGRLEDGHLMTLAELRGRVAVELQDLRERRAGVGSHRVVARARGRELGDAAHAHGMVVAPDSIAARDGEQSAVVWKRLYLRPPAASRSAVGVRHGPPNALDAPKPTSSSRITSTLGAPLGGRNRTIGGNLVSGSLAS
jgi:hypothetical protein